MSSLEFLPSARPSSSSSESSCICFVGMTDALAGIMFPWKSAVKACLSRGLRVMLLLRQGDWAAVACLAVGVCVSSDLPLISPHVVVLRISRPLSQLIVQLATRHFLLSSD